MAREGAGRCEVKADPVTTWCYYHREGWRFYNHGGSLPCETCSACVAERASLERLHRWNAVTAAGANPRR